MEERKMDTVDGKRAMAQYLWLSYFNEYLFTHGCITEEERNKMSSKINEKYASISNSEKLR